MVDHQGVRWGKGHGVDVLGDTQVHVPLDASNPTSAEPGGYHPSGSYVSEDGDADGHDTTSLALLPMTHLTPTTILGGGTIPERETMGQLLATQTASLIAAKNPDESRMLVLGLGLRKTDADREVFFDLIDLVRRCL